MLLATFSILPSTRTPLVVPAPLVPTARSQLLFPPCVPLVLTAMLFKVLPVLIALLASLVSTAHKLVPPPCSLVSALLNAAAPVTTALDFTLAPTLKSVAVAPLARPSETNLAFSPTTVAQVPPIRILATMLPLNVSAQLVSTAPNQLTAR